LVSFQVNIHIAYKTGSDIVLGIFISFQRWAMSISSY
jgi:hypothetical protein